MICRKSNKQWNVNKFSWPKLEVNLSVISLIQFFATLKPLLTINNVQIKALDAISGFEFEIASFNNLSTTLTDDMSMIWPKILKQFGFIKLSPCRFISVINDPVKINEFCQKFNSFTNKNINLRNEISALCNNFDVLKKRVSFSSSVNFSPWFIRYIKFTKMFIHSWEFMFLSLNIDEFCNWNSFRTSLNLSNRVNYFFILTVFFCFYFVIEFEAFHEIKYIK